MSLSTQPYKGARDFYPEDKQLQQWMFGVWQKTVESFGYEQYDAPLLEPTEIYATKTSDEIVNEQTYSFVDRGNRAVTIRTEMTPSVSRMVAGKRQELAYPLRWYSIPNLWRYERPQRGRLREFWQLNVDLFGISNLSADFEMVQLSNALMKAFGAKPSMYTIKVNSRKLINFILEEYLKLDDVESQTLIHLFDKMHKMPESEFLAKLDAVISPDQREHGVTEKILALLKAKRLNDLPTEIQSHSSVKELSNLLELANQDGISNVNYDITLMRGFNYYTDIVYEVFDTHPDNNRSMFGGGRYDGLVAQFGVEPVPTVGFGMGDATLYNFLVLHDLLPKLKSRIDVYAILLGNVYEQALKPIELLREMELNVAVDSTGRKLDKQIKTADKKGIRYVMFIGDLEITTGQYKIKDLQTGMEESHSLERIASMIKDYRKK
jgi:histidyl-tRNA synthetase